MILKISPRTLGFLNFCSVPNGTVFTTHTTSNSNTTPQPTATPELRFSLNKWDIIKFFSKWQLVAKIYLMWFWALSSTKNFSSNEIPSQNSLSLSYIHNYSHKHTNRYSYNGNTMLGLCGWQRSFCIHISPLPTKVTKQTKVNEWFCSFQRNKDFNEIRCEFVSESWEIWINNTYRRSSVCIDIFIDTILGEKTRGLRKNVR